MTPIALSLLLLSPVDIAPPQVTAEPDFSELRAKALDLHDAAATSRKKADADKAIAAYRLYLKKAGDKAEQPAEVKYFIGELLFEHKRFLEAHEQFRASAQEDPKGVQALRASFRAVIAAENLAKRGGRVNLRRVVDAAVLHVAIVDDWIKRDEIVDEDERAAVLWSEAEARKKLGDAAGQKKVLERLARDFADDVYGDNASQLLNPPKPGDPENAPE